MLKIFVWGGVGRGCGGREEGVVIMLAVVMSVLITYSCGGEGSAGGVRPMSAASSYKVGSSCCRVGSISAAGSNCSASDIVCLSTGNGVVGTPFGWIRLCNASCVLGSSVQK